MTRQSWILVVAVSTAVAALSLTRMQVYAVHANERDAVSGLRSLGRALEDWNDDPARVREVVSAEAPATGAPSMVESPARGRPAPRLSDLADASQGLTDDARWSEDGLRLRRRGYWFELLPSPLGNHRLRAWPCEHATTGRAAFVWLPGGAVLGHHNTDARWTGDQPVDVGVIGSEWIELAP